MKRQPAWLAAWSPSMLSLFRAMTALLFLEHGTAKIFGFPHVAMFDGLSLVSLLGLTGAIEIAGSALLLLGIFTRPVAFLLSGEMAVAYFMDHAPSSFYPLLNDGEPAVFYCFAFLYLSVAGGGALSLDAWRRRKFP
ncbi:MAG TPA: DoxX family protein [Candidatus Udaeobacter sp.]|nr:DoxX family protein [Candidatus Udaeobacter sp.]